MSASVLHLNEYGVAFNEKVVLSSLTLDIPATGVVVIMGPSGTGKSTLLRSIAQLSAASPSHRCWGECVFAGVPVEQAEEVPALVSQSARLMMSSVLENIVTGLPERHTLTQVDQRDLVKRLLINAGLDELVDQLDRRVVELSLGVQRLLAIVRSAASGPRLLCIDEPTSDVDEEDTKRLLEYIKKESEKRAVMIVLHNQQQARYLGGKTALLAGGWVQEFEETETFFSSPKTKPGQDYVRSGNCTVPSADAKPEEVSEQHKAAIKPIPEKAKQFKSHVLGPRGFLWLKNGKLAGTPKPGLLKDIDYDLDGLIRVGVTHLVSLTEKEIDVAACNEKGIEVFRSPMPDMQAPSMTQAVDICQQITKLLADSCVVAVHCRAGLGRTGTVLAAQLIYEGDSAINALEKARNIEPRWVQSEAQVEFLEEFETFIRTEMKDLDGSSSSDVSNVANM